MEQQNRDLVYSAVKDVRQTIRDIYQSLDGKPATTENIAESIAGFFPRQSVSEVRESCEQLMEGVREGHADFSLLSELSEEELEDELPKLVDQHLSDLSPEQLRQYLILLLQLLYTDSERRVNSNLTLYFSSLSTEDLKKNVCFLIRQKGSVIAAESAAAFSESLDMLNDSLSNPEAAAYSKEENDRIVAAAVFAAMQRSHRKILHINTASELGKQIGFEQSFMRKAVNTLQKKVLPGVFCLASIAAIAVGFHFLLTIPLVSEGAAMIMGFVKTNHMTKLAISTIAMAASGIIAGIGCFYDQLFSGPVAQHCIQNGYTARSALDSYFERMQFLADSSAVQPYATVEPYVDAPDHSANDFVFEDSQEASEQTAPVSESFVEA